MSLQSLHYFKLAKYLVESALVRQQELFGYCFDCIDRRSVFFTREVDLLGKPSHADHFLNMKVVQINKFLGLRETFERCDEANKIFEVFVNRFDFFLAESQP
jgi:hypothetical protein